MTKISWLSRVWSACAWVARPITARWRTRRHELWPLVFVGVAFEIVLKLADTWPPVVIVERWALDAAMVLNADSAQAAARNVPQLALLEVDEETWRDPAWGGGEPAMAPRDPLFTLIKFALDHNARYVVVDIAIEGKDDGGFAAKVAALNPDELRSKGQHLLFVRTLRAPLDAHPRLAAEWRASALDGLEASGHVHAVAPYFRASADGIVREWELWQPGCRTRDATGRGVWQVLPSVQLVVAALQLPPHLQEQARLPPWASASSQPCIVNAGALLTGDARPAAEASTRLDAALMDWLRTQPELTSHGMLPSGAMPLISRVYFSSRFPPRPDQALRISALDVLTSSPRLAQTDFKRGVVVLGQTFEAGRDTYTTPIGAMPGAFVILNSIRSMLSPGLLLKLPLGAELAMSALSILAFSVLYTFFGGWRGTLVISATSLPG